MEGDNRRARLLRAALGFLALEPRVPELQLLHPLLRQLARCRRCRRGDGAPRLPAAPHEHRPGDVAGTFSHDAMTAAEGLRDLVRPHDHLFPLCH